MKYIGIDFGTKRVGVAISDESGMFAFPKDIFTITNAEKNIVALCKKEVISGIVIGESIAGNEAVNEVHEKVKRFADRLSKATALPLFFQREDFSSVEAHRFQTTAGARDDSAAAIILQRFLDKKKHIAL